MTPLQTLFSNHLYKDIDQNFVDALEAILFLTPPQANEFDNVATLEQEIKTHKHSSSHDSVRDIWQQAKNSYYSDPNNDEYTLNDMNTNALGNLLKHKIFGEHLQKQQKEVISHQYGVTDFIIYKLLENVRRLYSAHKKNTPNTQKNGNSQNTKGIMGLNNIGLSIEALQEQTGFIYQVVQMTREHLRFTEKTSHYPRAILGNDVNCSALDIWGYLCFHEQIPASYKALHLEIFKEHMDNHVVSKNFLSHFQNLLYQPSQKDMVKLILNHARVEDVLDVLLNEQGRPKYGWLLLALEHVMEKKVELNLGQKEKLLRSIFTSDLLDNKFYEQFVDTQVFEYHLDMLYSDKAVQSHLQEWFRKFVPLEQIGIKRSADFIFNKIEQLDSESIFYQTLVSGNLSHEQKNLIFNKYARNDEQMKRFATHIQRSSPNGKVKQHLSDFLSLGDNIQNKALLAHIISLDASYMEICKSIYQNIRLQEKLGHRGNTTPMRQKKI